MSEQKSSGLSAYIPRGISVGGCLTPQITNEPFRRRVFRTESPGRTSIRKTVFSVTRVSNSEGKKLHPNLRARARQMGWGKVNGKWIAV